MSSGLVTGVVAATVVVVVDVVLVDVDVVEPGADVVTIPAVGPVVVVATPALDEVAAVVAVVVVSSTCSAAPARGAVPRKMSRIAFMFGPSTWGISTDCPLLFAPVACTWYVWIVAGG